MSGFAEIAKNLAECNQPIVRELVQVALDQGIPAKEILEAYQILYNDLDTNSAEKILYVLLTIVSDRQTGARTVRRFRHPLPENRLPRRSPRG